jgi:ABC-2 type transport system ATP-binding protein
MSTYSGATEPYLTDAVAVTVKDLTKNYGTFPAVKGIDFEIHTGEVFGLLGPNGAGKTTTVEILEGLRTRSGGAVCVLGIDPARDSRRLKDRIGVCLQATHLADKITVSEAVRLFASLYSRQVDGEALLKRLQLWEKRNSLYSKLSGGQKQRLALALALVNDPQILFLDEPSTGLDPQARHEIHQLVQEWRAERRTILLTTHYIEEAERLCDRVAIIDEGRIIAMGTPEEVQSKTVGTSHIEIRVSPSIPEGRAPALNNADRLNVSADRHNVTVSARHPARALVELVKWVDQEGLELTDVQLRRPSLEDVFIELTGKSLRE